MLVFWAGGSGEYEALDTAIACDTIELMSAVVRWPSEMRNEWSREDLSWRVDIVRGGECAQWVQCVSREDELGVLC